MATAQRFDSAKAKLARLMREPTIHFFMVGAALLAGHRLAMGDQRAIVITPALKADLLRNYRDQLNRPLTKAEADAFMVTWKSDEALYREALREGIDRDDPTVRNVLIGKMRERVMLRAPMPAPTKAELQKYLEQHRDQFDTPAIYEHEYVAFLKSDPAAERERAEYERQLKAGATTASLGLRSTVANVNRERIDREFGPEVAEKVSKLPIGQWQELETGDRLLLVKMIAVHGGLPAPDVLHAALVANFQAARAQKALESGTRAIAERYRFEEPSQ